MQKTADKKQKIKRAETGAACKFRRVYAFRVSPAGDGSVALKIRILGGFSRVCPLGVAKLPMLVSQIDSALADGECEFEIGGERFSASEKLLGELRKELFSYCCTHRGASDGASRAIAAGATSPTAEGASEKALRSSPAKFCSKSRGASDANRVPGGVSTPSKTKASARAAVAPARQFLNSAPRTRRGRTSVIVTVRKVASFQPKTKGKSK